MRKKFAIGACVCALAWAGSNATAATVSFPVGGLSGVRAQANGDGGASDDQPLILVLPDNGTQTASAGNASASISYDITPGQLGFSFTLSRTAENSSSAAASGAIDFMPVQDVFFTATGGHSAGGKHGLSLSASLFALTSGDELFQSIQESRDQIGPSFALGGQSGDSRNVDTGDLSGVLLAGQTYRLDFAAGLGRPLRAGDSEAGSSGGSLNLSFTAVPEPSTAAVLASAAGFVAYRRRRRR